MLRRLSKHVIAINESEGKIEKRKSKRGMLARFFKSRKQQPPSHNESNAPTVVVRSAPQEPPRNLHTAKATKREQSNSTIDMIETPPPLKSPLKQAKRPPAPTSMPSTPISPPEVRGEEKVEVLSEDYINALFAGAPHFSIAKTNGHATPRASYTGHSRSTASIASDSVPPVQPAFSAVTMRRHPHNVHHSSDKARTYQGYEVDVVEMPSMLSAQGIEPGSVGFSHFLELPKADVLVSDLQQSRSSLELQTTKNKELMHTNPERIGIRPVESSLIYDRLAEFHDLYEHLQESPQYMMSFYSNSGELYANLFSKFLTPPGYDGSTDDPTGLKVQIRTLLKVLRMEGIWYDFSLVEWRIRLGQILWSEPDPISEYETQPLWTERDILLLQITLACELLLRLDIVATMNTKDVKEQRRANHKNVQSFLDLKTKKIDWDLVLARRFLDNIKVVMEGDEDLPIPVSKARTLFSMWSRSTPEEPRKPDIILLPQHQVRQLSGLLHFAETIKWPNIDAVLEDLAQKLGLLQNAEHLGQIMSPDVRFLDPTTSTSISVYGTPLQTPYSTNLHDGYFGRVGKYDLIRSNSRSLRMPLSPSLESVGGDASGTMNNVGGWLSRSYLTGLILPGEAISHFLISTLLENDRLAIDALGDSANLYGGFIYADRTWWSKSSIVGRVLACVDDAVECMGWISFQKLPEGLGDGWIAVHSEQLPSVHPLRITAEEDLVARDSAFIPSDWQTSVKSEDLTLPCDSKIIPRLSMAFTSWDLTPLNSDLLDVDVTPRLAMESDIHVPSVTFTSYNYTVNHTVTLVYDIQFITSWPCTRPASALTSANIPAIRHVQTRSLTDTLSRASSERSTTARHSRRNSHGYEPLLSHPPDSSDIAPQRMYMDGEQEGSLLKLIEMKGHPLHKSYRYKVVPATALLDPDFIVPFSTTGSNLSDKKAVLVLDARGSADLELLARAWCAEKGFHAVIGRVGRTCLACCIREARGLDVKIVIRV